MEQISLLAQKWWILKVSRVFLSVSVHFFFFFFSEAMEYCIQYELHFIFIFFFSHNSFFQISRLMSRDSVTAATSRLDGKPPTTMALLYNLTMTFPMALPT